MTVNLKLQIIHCSALTETLVLGSMEAVASSPIYTLNISLSLFQTGTYAARILNGSGLSYICPGQGRHISGIKCRKYNKLDNLKFQHDINTFDWTNIMQEGDCNKAAELFSKQLVHICDLHAPMCTITMKNNAPVWTTNGFLAHTLERKNLLQIF